MKTPNSSNKIFIIILGLIALLLFSCDNNTQFREGDIIFHTSRSAQSKAIQLATDSAYSHVGLITFQNGEAYVLEAVQPVKLTPLSKWIKRGEKSEYVVKRLKETDLLTKNAIHKMSEKANSYLGKNYDSYFEWSDDKIYCSELVWKLYKYGLNIELGELQRLEDFNLDNPVVKQKLLERYGNDIPLNEPVIAPSDIFDSEFLELVK